MNLTENEIRGLPLEQKQKLVIELRGIQPGDKAYPNAKAIIELITSDKKYQEPTLVKVKALDNVLVDGRDVKKDQETELLPWQYAALSRFFEVTEQLTKNGLGKVAAVAALILGLLAPNVAQAQYKLTPVGGLNGGTNVIAATSGVTALATSTSVTTIITNPVVTISNGTPVFSVSYVTNTVTTTPGLVNLARYDAFSLQFNFALTGAGTTAVVLPLSQSVDGTNFWPLANLSVTAAGTATVTGGTNFSGWNPGYLLCGNITNANGTIMTNVSVQVGTKGTRAGP